MKHPITRDEINDCIDLGKSGWRLAYEVMDYIQDNPDINTEALQAALCDCVYYSCPHDGTHRAAQTKTKLLQQFLEAARIPPGDAL